MILLLASGATSQTVAAKLDLSEPTIAQWKRRFVAESVNGLVAKDRTAMPSARGRNRR